MGFEVRRAAPEDAAGIAAVWAAAVPYLVKTAKAIETELRVRGSSRAPLVAVDGGGVVGSGYVYLPDPADEAPRVRFSVHVPPDERGRGVGSVLTTAAIEAAVEAGARSLLVVVADDEQSQAFAEHRGFAIGREMSHSRADLAEVPPPAEVPSGLRLVDFGDLEPRQVYDATTAVAGGDPSGLSHVPPYEEWVAAGWESPDLRRDLSVALLDGSSVVSFVATTADPDRKVIWSNLTGTIPAYRGRGLAKVVKSHALNRSHAAGFEAAYTGNDANNLPMLAVNAWLGYRVVGSAWTAEKTL